MHLHCKGRISHTRGSTLLAPGLSVSLSHLFDGNGITGPD